MNSFINWTDLQTIDGAVQPAFLQVPKTDLVEGLPDGILAAIAPVVAYWVYSSFYHIIDVYELAEKYRIHPSEEMLTRNTVTVAVVVRDVIFQHIIQTVAALVFYQYDTLPTTGFENNTLWTWRQNVPGIVPTWTLYLIYWYGLSLLKIAVAFVIIDSWQYMLHRAMHLNKWLYRRFHSRHHKLYVPYAFGALFNDPVEGFLLDTIGAGLASLVTGLTPREQIFLYTFSTLKTVDDHCGYSFPFDPFQLLFPNNSIYHDIHHQHFGIKYNFSQPFFTMWDSVFDTTFHGVDEYAEKQKKITLEKYKQFLHERKQKNAQRKAKEASRTLKKE
ncbi:hypothetical protein OGAPHI_006594 [Ogataea philodendri]|uniref:Fatty acid hydroxylase domain-containing protein n=1 Tax=Ogataea philodendri TaxID=1378263 RepID=A0A9P8NX49_9ASCO|nr:uncharacterized protein OGAPHI_006594 [Ogataea philodendri]KAH3661187.1 hypothetical protein OGAPHI_006594 [Ogataea philodendri]